MCRTEALRTSASDEGAPDDFFLAVPETWYQAGVHSKMDKKYFKNCLNQACIHYWIVTVR